MAYLHHKQKYKNRPDMIQAVKGMKAFEAGRPCNSKNKSFIRGYDIQKGLKEIKDESNRRKFKK